MPMTVNEALSVLATAYGGELLPVLNVRPDENPVAVYLAQLGTQKSRRSQASALRGIAAELGTTPDRLEWRLLRYQHTNAIRARLVERLSPSTANRYLAALKGVLREARRLGQISAEDCLSACDLRPAKGSRLPAGRLLSRNEIRRLFRACAADPKAGKRDAALLAVGFGCGLRRAEIADLDVAHWNASDSSLRVMGKGSKERICFVLAGRPQLDAWLEQRGPAEGALFCAISRGGNLLRHRLSDNAILLTLRRMAERANVEPFAPHDLRRAAITRLLEEGVDLAAAQRFAGHSSPAVTARYDKRGDEAVRIAAGKIRF